MRINKTSAVLALTANAFLGTQVHADEARLTNLVKECSSELEAGLAASEGYCSLAETTSLETLREVYLCLSGPQVQLAVEAAKEEGTHADLLKRFVAMRQDCYWRASAL